MNAFPVQAAKVQSPPLRDDVLARDRLLDWLHAKIHQRLVLLLAEAGYGKTTLLADFASRTRLRTLWYRLDEDDRDWVTVMHHLVAAGREHDAGFAPRTAGMLSDTGVAGPSRDAVVDAYLRELPSIAEHGLILILDDFHLVDESADVKAIAKELLARAPERVSIVIASRRTPTIPIARLRAAGEVAELRTDDLRFDADETARLFSESYKRPLEPDVLRDLSARTEGWAASLQLVQAALRDRSPLEIRRFVRNLTGADQELYDYLAEEVVGDLPDDLQQFLMRTSILQVVTPGLAEVVTGLSAADVRRLTTLAERYSLLSRRGSVQRDHLRYHPLVRDFLEDRLEREGGRALITDLHRTVAAASEAGDWRTACYHYSVIGDTAAIGRTIDGAVEEIIARGDTIVALSYLSTDVPDERITSHEVLRSRAEFRRGERAAALQRAQDTANADPASAVALGNLASIAFSAGDAKLAWATARTIADHSDSESAALMGDGMLALLGSSVDADLRQTTDLLSRLRVAQRARGHVHHEAISLLNLASHQKARGEAEASLQYAGLAASLLAEDQSSGELSAALATKAWAHAHLGELHAAREIYRLALSNVETSGRAETLIEAAEVEVWYGSADRAGDLMAEIARDGTTPLLEQYADVVGAQIAVRNQRLEEAASLIERFRVGEFGAVVGLKAQQLTTRAYWSLVSRRSNAESQLRGAIQHAEAQGATFWLEIDRLLLGAADGPQQLNREVRRLGSDSGVYFSVVAEVIVQRLAELGADETQLVRREIETRRERWLPALRRLLEVESESSAKAARLINDFGFAEDVPLLRRLSKRRSGDPDLGRDLARRVADPVFVEDQGRVALLVGSRRIEGTAVRRKVLTLLCFLLTRARFSSTRDEVLDSLWPNFEPAVALNSLNQTLYFLRRVFEPAYREDTSPGYVRHESDVVWLDRQLIKSRSQVCGDFIRSLGARPSPDEVEQVTSLYQGRFALDFAYEEWAVAYRDALHAGYLQVVENAVAADMATGHWERGIVTARRALSVDPEAEQIEASLVRLLRLSGAHAAAAEQYEHYSTVLKEGLGIEPPPLDAL